MSLISDSWFVLTLYRVVAGGWFGGLLLNELAYEKDMTKQVANAFGCFAKVWKKKVLSQTRIAVQIHMAMQTKKINQAGLRFIRWSKIVGSKWTNDALRFYEYRGLLLFESNDRRVPRILSRLQNIRSGAHTPRIYNSISSGTPSSMGHHSGSRRWVRDHLWQT